ncbi:MAG: hypothetical protein ACLPND_00040 [Candidatus Korobacteraceae bacterium]|jgi:TolA-binding protein
MSIAGIAGTAFAQLANVQRNYQKVQGEFKQLGQDLQAGNLTQAQADFVTLTESLASNQQTGAASSSGSPPTTPPTFVGPNAVNQSAQTSSASGSHHRIHFRQALSQLAQALQSGDLSTAQQAFATMEQIWQQFGSSAVSTTAATQVTPVNVNV